MNRDVIKQLKSLKHDSVNPSSEWLGKSRALLMSQIKNTLPASTSKKVSEKIWARLSIYIPKPIVYNVVRPVAVIVLVTTVASTVYSGAAKATDNTLPGDSLYGLKRATEQAQGAVISFLGDKNSETKFHLNLANRRADETRKIIQKDDPKKVADVVATVAALKNEINSLKNKLDKNSESQDKMPADVIREVKNNTEQLKVVLQDAKNDLLLSNKSTLSENKLLSKEVSEAKDLVKDVSVKVVAVLVDDHLSGGQVTKEEVTKAINNTIDNVTSEVKESVDNANGAKVIVETAKTAVKDLTKDLASEIKRQPALATTTQDFANKLVTAVTEAKEAAIKTEVASAVVDKKITEAKELMVTGDLTKAVDKLSEANQATKDAEKISDNTVEKAQLVLPIVQVIKDVSSLGATTTAVIVSSTKDILSITPTGTVVSSSVNSSTAKPVPTITATDKTKK